MANIKQAKKRILVNDKKAENNKKRRSEVKTYTRKFNEALENNDIKLAEDLLKIVDKKLKAASYRNIIHKNAASRKLSKLTKKLNQAK